MRTLGKARTNVEMRSRMPRISLSERSRGSGSEACESRAGAPERDSLPVEHLDVDARTGRERRLAGRDPDQRVGFGGGPHERRTLVLERPHDEARAVVAKRAEHQEVAVAFVVQRTLHDGREPRG